VLEVSVVPEAPVKHAPVEQSPTAVTSPALEEVKAELAAYTTDVAEIKIINKIHILIITSHITLLR
jgi:hypothetical protein